MPCVRASVPILSQGDCCLGTGQACWKWLYSNQPLFGGLAPPYGGSWEEDGREAGSGQGRWAEPLSYGHLWWGEEWQSLRAGGSLDRDYGICSVESFDSGDIVTGENNWDCFVRMDSLKRFECEGSFGSDGLIADVLL